MNHSSPDINSSTIVSNGGERTGSRTSGEAEAEASRVGVPLSFKDVASLEAQEILVRGAGAGGACVVVSWICRWKGSLRRGMQVIYGIPALVNGPVSASSGPPTSTPPTGPCVNLPNQNSNSQFLLDHLEDLLSVAIKHPAKVELKRPAEAAAYDSSGPVVSCDVSSGSGVCGSASSAATPVDPSPAHLNPTFCAGTSRSMASVAVRLELLSTSSVPLRVTVEAIDKRDRQPRGQPTTSSSFPSTSSVLSNAFGTDTPSLSSALSSASSVASATATSGIGVGNSLFQRNIRWDGKTKFSELIIPPYTSMILPFNAVVSRTGVFDLNRY